MEYQTLYKNFSPLKFKLNNDFINKVQQNQPLVMSFDNIAMNNLKNYLNNNIDNLNMKYTALKKKSYLITLLEINTLKIFLVSFILLYLVAPKFEMLREEDEIKKDVFKPNLIKISIISLIISLFFLGHEGINLLIEFKKIIFS
jgi:hypothetical protein